MHNANAPGAGTHVRDKNSTWPRRTLLRNHHRITKTYITPRKQAIRVSGRTRSGGWGTYKEMTHRVTF